MQSSRYPGPSHPLGNDAEKAPGTRLKTVLDKASKLAQLNARLRRSLPAALADHCTVANVRDNQLILLADSQLWAARLRLHYDDLIQAARAALGADDVKIAVKVAVSEPVPQAAQSALPLSAAAAGHLRAAAHSLADPELRSLFLRLASKANSDC